MEQRTGSRTIDFLDDFTEFARIFPAWMDGMYPISWRAFVIGQRHLSKIYARAQMQTFSATAMAFGADQQLREQWLNDTTSAAGWG